MPGPARPSTGWPSGRAPPSFDGRPVNVASLGAPERGRRRGHGDGVPRRARRYGIGRVGVLLRRRGTGSGVAVDGNGDVALTGTFGGDARARFGRDTQTSQSPAGTDSFVALFGSSSLHQLKWGRSDRRERKLRAARLLCERRDSLEQLQPGMLAVSGYYTGSLGGTRPLNFLRRPRRASRPPPTRRTRSCSGSTRRAGSSRAR